MMWPLWHWYTSLPTLSLHTGHSRDSSTLFIIEVQRQLAGPLDKLLRRDWMKSSTLFCVLGFDDLAAMKRLGGKRPEVSELLRMTLSSVRSVGT